MIRRARLFILATIDDIAQGRCQRTIAGNLLRVLRPRCPIHFFEYKTLHGIYVDNCFHEHMTRVRQNLVRQRLVKINGLHHLKNLIPDFPCWATFIQHESVIGILLLKMREMADLRENQTKENLLGRGEQSYVVIEVAVYHLSSRIKLLHVLEEAPVPGKPLQVLAVE